MKFGIIIFPGSNCDRDMVHVLQNVISCEVKTIFHKEKELLGFSPRQDCIVLPGGFSYGDYLRTGAIARFSPIMQSVVNFANEGGKVLGICNGFQILCEAGLLPGALLRNTSMKYSCKNIFLKTETFDTDLTRHIPQKQLLKIPIAHGDGRYHADAETLKKLEKNQQILFRYCDMNGKISEDSNPNGSLGNIAGICNVEKNVFGMMPHPERASEFALGNVHGRLLFESLVGAPVLV